MVAGYHCKEIPVSMPVIEIIINLILYKLFNIMSHFHLLNVASHANDHTG